MKAQLLFHCSGGKRDFRDSIQVSLVLPKGKNSSEVITEGKLIKAVLVKNGNRWQIENADKVIGSFCFVSKDSFHQLKTEKCLSIFKESKALAVITLGKKGTGRPQFPICYVGENSEETEEKLTNCEGMMIKLLVDTESINNLGTEELTDGDTFSISSSSEKLISIKSNQQKHVEGSEDLKSNCGSSCHVKRATLHFFPLHTKNDQQSSIQVMLTLPDRIRINEGIKRNLVKCQLAKVNNVWKLFQSPEEIKESICHLSTEQFGRLKKDEALHVLETSNAFAFVIVGETMENHLSIPICFVDKTSERVLLGSNSKQVVLRINSESEIFFNKLPNETSTGHGQGFVGRMRAFGSEVGSKIGSTLSSMFKSSNEDEFISFITMRSSWLPGKQFDSQDFVKACSLIRKLTVEEVTSSLSRLMTDSRMSANPILLALFPTFINKACIKNKAEKLRLFEKLVSNFEISREFPNLHIICAEPSDECISNCSEKVWEYIKYLFDHYHKKQFKSDDGLLMKSIWVMYYHCGKRIDDRVLRDQLKRIRSESFFSRKSIETLTSFMNINDLGSWIIFTSSSLDRCLAVCEAVFNTKAVSKFDTICMTSLENLDRLIKNHSKVSDEYVHRFLQLLERLPFNDIPMKRLVNSFVNQICYSKNQTLRYLQNACKIPLSADIKVVVNKCLSGRLCCDLVEKTFRNYNNGNGAPPVEEVIRVINDKQCCTLLLCKEGEDSLKKYMKSIPRKKILLVEALELWISVTKAFPDLRAKQEFKNIFMNSVCREKRDFILVWKTSVDNEVLLSIDDELQELIVQAAFAYWPFGENIIDPMVFFSFELYDVRATESTIFKVLLRSFISHLNAALLKHDLGNTIDWIFLVIIDGRSSSLMKEICQDLFKDCFHVNFPKTIYEILNLNDQALHHLSELLHGSDSLIPSKDRIVLTSRLKQVVLQWVYDFTLQSFTKQSIIKLQKQYSVTKFEFIHLISGVQMPSEEDIYREEKYFTETELLLRDDLIVDLDGELRFISDILDSFMCKRSEIHSLCSKYTYLKHESKSHSTLLLCEIMSDQRVISNYRIENDESICLGAYFLSHTSQMFYRLLDIGNNRQISSEALFDRLKMAGEKLRMLFTGEATYKEFKQVIPDNSEWTLSNLDAEVERISRCPFFDISEDDVRVFRSVYCLVPLTLPLDDFIKCCMQFKLSFVNDDDSFRRLKSVCDELMSENFNERVTHMCTKVTDQLSEILGFDENIHSSMVSFLLGFIPLFDLFSSLSKCSDVWFFAKENKWLGNEGISRFYEQYENVTNVLLGEKSIESKILDSVAPAIRFVSFLYEEHFESSLSDLLFHIRSDVSFSRGFEKLSTDLNVVQTNILQIQGWFTNGIDDVATVLNTHALILASGYYNYGTDDSGQIIVHLNFKLSSGEMERLDGSDLLEFIRHLGFVQHENEKESEALSTFIEEYSVITKLAENMTTINLIGAKLDQVSYFPHRVASDSGCVAVAKLRKSIEDLGNFRNWCQDIYEKNIMLHLFWVKEQSIIGLCILKSQSQQPLSVVDLNCFINFLSCVSRGKIFSSAEVTSILDKMMLDHETNYDGWLPLVSRFLRLCLTQFEASVPFSCLSSTPTNKSLKGIHVHSILCDELLKEEVAIRLLLKIFLLRLPERYEVLDGRLCWSKEDMTAFLSRIKHFQSGIFVVINVQEFPHILRDFIFQHMAKMCDLAGDISFHCIQAKSNILPALPWINLHIWDSMNIENLPCLSLSSLKDKHGWIKNFAVVSSNGCNGKTKYIKSKIKNLCYSHGYFSGTFYFNEGFEIRSVISFLFERFQGVGAKKVVHFIVSFGPSNGLDRKHLLSMINSFFVSFIFVGHLYDPKSGLSFDIRRYKWQVFLELQIPDTSISREQWLKTYIPAVSFVGDVEFFPVEFEINNETRRVCTYLRAYNDGTINRKFVPFSKSIVFVLDESGSMAGSRANEAVNNIIQLFDSHVQVGDYISLISFADVHRTILAMEQVTSETHRRQMREILNNARNILGGGTNMYTALSSVFATMHSNQVDSKETWVVCLTDGESQDSITCCKSEIEKSAANIHLIIIGVGLHVSLHPLMQDLCRKFLPDSEMPKGFFIPTATNIASLREAFKKVASCIPVSQTFELDGVLSDDECRNLMKIYLPKKITDDMLLKQFWIRFLHRRVKVFDENEAFNFNEEYDELGSSLMKTMIAEAERLVLSDQEISWSEMNYPQLIYDFSEGKPLFRLICTSPEQLDYDTRIRFEALKLPGFFIPTKEDLEKRQTLDKYLSQAMGLTMQTRDDGTEFLEIIDRNKFVLTLDFTMKLLNIHERVECRIPCIMEGETGVSKTALTRMYSILRNSSLQRQADRQTLLSLETIVKTLGFSSTTQGSYVEIINNYVLGGSTSTTHTDLGKVLEVELLLKDECSKRDDIFETIPLKFQGDSNGEVAIVREFLDWFSKAHLKCTFFELCIDSAVTSKFILDRFSEINEIAWLLERSGFLVVVFLDEVNTSSILGLFKEIIIDRNLNGDDLAPNLVVVAACNPARTISITQGGQFRENDLGKEFFSGHYQVFDMPQSMSSLKWSYGSLNSSQEKEFIFRRMQMLNHNIPPSLLLSLTQLVSIAHESIRSFATEHIYSRLQELYPEAASYKDAQSRARAMVSLRDIQRVFYLFEFFMSEVGQRCVFGSLSCENVMLLTIAVTYYVRLDSLYRRKLLEIMDGIEIGMDSKRPISKIIVEMLKKSTDHVISETSIPLGVALTDGLKENIYIILVCALSKTPLMIVGPPGTSKTLSVNLVTDNGNGEQSRSPFYRLFPRLQPFHYQCSKTSTSDEVASVFTRAMERQKGLDARKDQCLVFMDEAGLPEEEKESLKVLHYFLEGHMSARSDISFVCISNHVLDAAKSNRCICLLRPEPNDEDLINVVFGILFNSSINSDCLVQSVALESEQVLPIHFAQRLCTFYLDLSRGEDKFQWFNTFYGLRDFVHLLKAISRYSNKNEVNLCISTESIKKAFEMNFNGTSQELFNSLFQYFWKTVCPGKLSPLPSSIVDVVMDSLSQASLWFEFSYRPRYKLIIDKSDDDSVMRLLNIGNSSSTPHSLFKFSGIEVGDEIEKLNLVSGVKYAALQGHLAILSETNEIHECFYDLFNLNFRKFSGRDSDVYYANISVGGISRPSLVHPSFQCVVHVRQSQLLTLPAPFLNRFEKFSIGVHDVLRNMISSLDDGTKLVVESAFSRVGDFCSLVGFANIFGYTPNQTVESIFISILTKNHDELTRCDIEEAGGCNYESIDESFLNHSISYVQTITSLSFITKQDILNYIQGSVAHKFQRIKNIIKSYHSQPKQLTIQDLMATLSNKDKVCVTKYLANLTHAIIIKSACSLLLELVTPEAIIWNRHNLPPDIIKEYFTQEHFDLSSLMHRIVNIPSKESLKKAIIHTRTHLKLLSLPNILVENENNYFSTEEVKLFDNLLNGNWENLVLIQFSSMNNEFEIRSNIESWLSCNHKDIMIVIVNMGTVNACEKVNYIRCCLDRRKSATYRRKIFLILLHYPPSFLHINKNIYPAVFLDRWNHHYLDNVGGYNSIDIKTWTMTACNIQVELEKLDFIQGAKELFSKCLIHISSEPLFYDHTDTAISINSRMKFGDRYKKLKLLMSEPLLEDVSCLDLMLEKFSEIWCDDALRRIFDNASVLIHDSATNLSLSSFVSGVFQDLFLAFLTVIMKEINEWRNLDILLPEQRCDITNELFMLILIKLPTPPFEELLVRRTTPYMVYSLPLFANNYDHSTVTFPFFLQLTQIVDELTETGIQTLRTNATEFKLETEEEALLVFHQVNTLSEDNALLYEVICFMKKLISSERTTLLERYFRQFLLWKVGCSNVSILLPWIQNYIKTLVMTHNLVDDGCASIFLIHIVSNLKRIHILQLASLTASLSEDSKENLEQSSLNFFDIMITFFVSCFSSKVIKSGLNSTLVSFLRNLPEYFDGEKFDDLKKVAPLRIVSFMNLLHSVAPVHTIEVAIKRYYQSETKFLKPSVFETKTVSSLDSFFTLLDLFDDRPWVHDVKVNLLKLFFSMEWLFVAKIHIVDDFCFVIDLIEGGSFVDTRLLTVLLRNALTISGCKDASNNVGLDVLLLSVLSDRILRCAPSASEEVSFRYTPPWLRKNPPSGEGQSNARSNYCDPIQNYYAYVESYLVGSLADALFEIILQQLSLHELSSVDSLSRLVTLIIADADGLYKNPTNTLMISALCTYTIIMTGYEIVETSSIGILESENGSRFFEVVMQDGSTNWIYLFFSSIERLAGKAGLINILKSKLNNFAWCKVWLEFIPQVKESLIKSLSDAEKKLKDQEAEEARKADEYYHCPFCDQLYGIDVINCGNIVCGRDAHTVNGSPTIGSKPVKEIYGCGKPFRHRDARNYTPDMIAVNNLKEDCHRFQQKLRNFESNSVIWDKYNHFEAPPLKFQMDRIATSPSILPVISILDQLDKSYDHTSGNILDLIMKEKSYLKHLSCLPYLIEFYLWLVSTFPYIMTKTSSQNLTMNDLMSEPLLLPRFNKNRTKYLIKLWTNVKKGFDSYLKATTYRTRWECEEINIPFTSINDASLFMLLSVTNHPTEGDEFQDILFLVINDIIEKYNAFVGKMNSLKETNSFCIVELDPKFLIRGGSTDIIFFSRFFSDQYQKLNSLIESHWRACTGSFDIISFVQGLEADLFSDLKHPIIKNPLDHLRQKFRFRKETKDLGHTIITSNLELTRSCRCDLVFANHRDCFLFDDTFTSILKKNASVPKYSLQNSFISMFHLLDYYQLRSILVGIKTMTQVETANASEIIGEIFPDLSVSQLRLIGSFKKEDMANFVFFLGYQLASEGYSYSNHGIHLKFLLPSKDSDYLRKNMHKLAETKGYLQTIKLIDSFIEEILIFYFSELSSVSPDESITATLKKRNFCDESDPVFAMIPATVLIRHYVSLRQELFLTRLLLLTSEDNTPRDTKSEATQSNNHTPSQHGFLNGNWMLMDELEIDESYNDNTQSLVSSASAKFWFEGEVIGNHD